MGAELLLGAKSVYDNGQEAVMSMKALSGIRVVEYGRRIAASYCAKVLADLGAEVVKIEEPVTGDPARQWGPFPADEPDPEKSGLFLALNANKKGITLDANSPDGQRLLLKLLRQADIFIYDLPPQEAERLGLGYARLGADMSSLICTLITPYGATGPYKDYKGDDLTVNAAGGLSHGIGFPEREPLRTPLSQASYLAGLAAAIATTMALLYREAGGEGQLVDIAESDVSAVLIDGIHLPTFIYRGVSGHRNGRRALMGRFPNTVIRCQDGWVCLHIPQLEQYLRFFKMIGEPAWGQNPRYRDRRAMAEQYPDEAEALLGPWFTSHTKQEVLDQLMAYHVPGSPVFTVENVFRSPHLRERSFFASLSHPKTGTLEYPIPPYRMSEAPCELLHAAPTLGQHNQEVFIGLSSLTAKEPERLTAEQVVDTSYGPSSARNAAMNQALAGYRVVDFGTALAGPLVGALLADMGAEVIKVETRTRLDGFRMGRPIIGEDVAGGDEGKWPDLMPGFHAVNRNKLSVTVDLKTSDGLRLIKMLIRKSDVVTNNYAPGVLERLGLDYPDLAKENPRLVMASMPAAGLTGPLRDMVSYASIISAASGLMSMIGYADGEMAGQVQGPWGDIVASLSTVMGILAGLRYRNLTGRGQFVEVAQLEAQVAMLGEAFMDYQMNRRVSGPEGNRHPRMAPHNIYPCAGDDRWVAIAVASQQEWESFCMVLGDPVWTKDVSFLTPESRVQHQAELDQHVARWASTRTPEEVMELLQGAGVAAMTVMNVEDHFTNPHFQERGFGVEVEQPMVGLEWLPGFPWHLSKTPGRVQRHAPMLGEHNEYVWCSIVGLSKEEYDRLVAAEVIK